VAGEDSERRPGLVLSGLSGLGGTLGLGPLARRAGLGPGPGEGSATSRMEWFGSPRAARYWRLLFSGIWLLYVIQPIGSLFRHHYGVLYIGGAIAIVTVFCSCYIRLWGDYEIARRQITRNGSLWAIVPLFVLAALACVVYDGAKWNALWIYVSAACGAISTDRRVAVRAVLAVGGCYVFFSWIGHVAVSDFLFTLLPVVLVGFAMIGFRAQIMMMRELRQARETVARLAASEERLRLARDMHDLTGQSLSMVTLKSELAARLLQRLPGTPERDRALEEIEQVAAVSRQTLHDIREAVSGYRRPTLAVEIITARTALEAAGIVLRDAPELTTTSGTFDPDTEAALAWCLREAVTNVVRHSGARACHISLTRDEDTFALTVRDDGHGEILSPARAAACIDPRPGSPAGAGLRGMSERLAAVGGRLQLSPGSDGFRLVATVPARAGATGATGAIAVTGVTVAT
jgi:two-component system sensor histidine kinase DesK